MIDTIILGLTEEDVDDLNKALSLSCVGAMLLEHGDGNSGVHVASLCDTIAQHLCNIRDRHLPEGRQHSSTFLHEDMSRVAGQAPERTLGHVLADAYDLGSADMEVVEQFLRAHRVSGLNMATESLRASTPEKIRALVGVK